MEPVAECRFVEVVDRRLQTSSLICALLFDQLLDPSLQPLNGTLATFGPMLKGLRLLEEFWLIADLNHVRTEHVHPDGGLSRRKLLLNRGS
jgi:hypothetical protein